VTERCERCGLSNAECFAEGDVRCMSERIIRLSAELATANGRIELYRRGYELRGKLNEVYRLGRHPGGGLLDLLLRVAEQLKTIDAADEAAGGKRT